jgi:recombination protein RecT
MSNVEKHVLQRDSVANKVAELMGDQKKSRAFLTSAMSVIQSNELLKKADQTSIYQSVMTAVTLDLPINPNLGYAYIVPFKGQAQLQVGYKGFIQLAWRSGLYKTISSTVVYEGQLVSQNPLTGFVFDFEKKTSNKVVGYAAYFELLNGASKTMFMSYDEVHAHAKKYSQTFKKGFGVWNDNFDEMGKKTVLKLLISKYAPMSVEMQTAVVADQSVVKDYEKQQYEYADNNAVVVEDKPKLTDVTAAKEAIKSGAATIEGIEEMYDVSPYQMEELNND